MTPDQWAAQKKNPRTALMTLDQARADARVHASRLDMITEGQWAMKHPAPPAQ